MYGQRHGDTEQKRPRTPARTVPAPQVAAPPVRGVGGPGRVSPAEVAALQSAAGNQAATAIVQRARESQMEADALARENTPPADEAALQASQAPDAVMVRLSASIEAHTLQKKRKFNFWEPHKKWPEGWLLENTRMQWVLERRLVLGMAFQQDELRDIEILSTKRPGWLNSVGIGTLAEGRLIAEGKGRMAGAGNNASGKNNGGKDKGGKDAQAAERERADYSAWLKLSPGRRVLAATLAFQTQAPVRGASTPSNPAYTLGRFMRTNELGPDDPERATLESERDEQIRETAVDTLFPDGLREEQKHESAGDHATKEMKGRDDFARNILTNVLLILRHGLQVAGKDGTYVDYKDGDVIRALAHGGRVNIRIPALRKGESPHQLLDFLGVTQGGTPHQHAVKRDYATHRSSIGKNKDGEPGSFKEKGGVGAAVKNKVSEYTPGMTNPELLAANLSGGGFGTKDWNGDVVLPNGSYGHMLLVFTAPTGDKDGGLLVGIETVAPGARSPVGYHHGVRSTEATANPESVLHGHKQDKIGATRAELGKMGGEDWHDFLQTIKQDWVGKLEAAKDTAQKRKLYEELVGPRE
ncbi:PE-PGRS family protein [Streptomyces sp. NBC_00076]|uniref:PE-PGRS family protein n=1 Tax=Streptomyces sp. NBC_00076 TaxID=2975642 RepID=UPI00324A13B3